MTLSPSSSFITSISSQSDLNSIAILSQQVLHPVTTLTIPDEPGVYPPSSPSSPSDNDSSKPSLVSSHSIPLLDMDVIPPGDGNRNPLRHDIVGYTDSAGIGLPIELWLYILRYLARDATTLLACALTRKGLHRHAQNMINKLRMRKIDATTYGDLDKLVEVLRTSPKFANTISRLYVKGGTRQSIPVVLSVIPVRLSSLLISLRELKFKDFTIDSQPYPSRWSLYGRAFPNVTELELEYIQFPSLKDFAALITSFPRLTTLNLVFPRFGSPGTFTGRFNKRKLTLRDLEILDENTSLFLAAFSPWLVQRDVRLRTLNIMECIYSEPCQQLLCHCREHLQVLTFHISPTPEPSTFQSVTKLAEICRLGFPALNSIEIWDIREHDLPWVMPILSNATRSLQEMELRVCPTSENIGSVTWKRLDVVLSSWFMVNHTKNNARLILDLWKSHPLDRNHSVESLFPLTTSLGEDKWGEFRTTG